MKVNSVTELNVVLLSSEVTAETTDETGHTEQRETIPALESIMEGGCSLWVGEKIRKGP